MDNTSKVGVYLAGPLFTHAEWQWNERLARALEERSLKVILPQRGAEPMLAGTRQFDPKILFEMNVSHIDSADVVVAIFDGPDVDSGTAWECGYAFKAGKPVVGVRTDIRAGGDDPQAATNLMLSLGCVSIVAAPLANRTDVSTLCDAIAKAVRDATSQSANAQRT
jgi:nucleoside 2-deoxyribosyltransferase